MSIKFGKMVLKGLGDMVKRKRRWWTNKNRFNVVREIERISSYKKALARLLMGKSPGYVKRNSEMNKEVLKSE